MPVVHLREAGESLAHGGSHLPLSSYCNSSALIEKRQAGVGVLSRRRAPNLVTSWCLHRVCAQPDFGSIDIFFLASSPLFSHPHGIYRCISTTVGAHRGADRGADWSQDPDGLFLCVGG